MANQTEQTYTRAQITDIVNRAADDVLEELDAPDEGVRDAINLLVNVFGARLDNSAATIRDVVLDGYSRDVSGNGEDESDDDMYDRVLGWARTGC